MCTEIAKAHMFRRAGNMCIDLTLHSSDKWAALKYRSTRSKRGIQWPAHKEWRREEVRCSWFYQSCCTLIQEEIFSIPQTRKWLTFSLSSQAGAGSSEHTCCLWLMGRANFQGADCRRTGGQFLIDSWAVEWLVHVLTLLHSGSPDKWLPHLSVAKCWNLIEYN